jgi:transposase
LAIANASLQIGLKSSKPKSEQQTMHTLETSRVYLSRSITSLSNHLRAMLYEYGILYSKGYFVLLSNKNTNDESSTLYIYKSKLS